MHSHHFHLSIFCLFVHKATYSPDTHGFTVGYMSVNICGSGKPFFLTHKLICGVIKSKVIFRITFPPCSCQSWYNKINPLVNPANFWIQISHRWLDPQVFYNILELLLHFPSRLESPNPCVAVLEQAGMWEKCGVVRENEGK